MDEFAIRSSDSEPEPLSALQVYLQLHSPREANQPKRSIETSNNTDKLRNECCWRALSRRVQIESQEGDAVLFLDGYELHLPNETFCEFNHEFRDSDIFVPNGEEKGARDSEMQPSSTEAGIPTLRLPIWLTSR